MTKEIRYTPAWKIALVLILWALLTGGLSYLGTTRAYDDYRFPHHAATVTGKVVQKYYTTSHSRHGTTYTYHVSYNFTAGKISGFCDQTVLRDTWHYLSEGGPVPVIYLPKAPDHVRVNLLAEERSIHLHTWEICLFAAAFLLAGGLGFTLTFRANSIYQRLQREGISCRAAVTDVGCDYVGKAQTPKFYLKLLYRDLQGGERTGRSAYLPREQEGRWREGDAVDLRYDRDKPQWFMIDLNPGRRDTPGADGNPNSRA